MSKCFSTWNPSSTVLVIARRKLISGALCDSPLLNFPSIQMLSFGLCISSLSIMPTYLPQICGGLGETINVVIFLILQPLFIDLPWKLAIYRPLSILASLVLQPLLLRIFGFNEILLTIVTPLLLSIVNV